METTIDKSFEDVPAGMHAMAVMGKEGDTKHIWDKTKPAEVEAAKGMWDKLVKENRYLAFSVTGKDGAKGEQMREFDPNAERIIFVPAMQGGLPMPGTGIISGNIGAEHVHVNSTDMSFDVWPMWNVTASVTTCSAGTNVSSQIWTAFNANYIMSLADQTAALNSASEHMNALIGTSMTSNTATVMNNIIWTAFNNQYVNNQYVASIGYSDNLRQVDPEVAARRIAEADRIRQRSIEVEGERALARGRAEKLLHESLSPIQLDELQKDGHFHLDVLSRDGDSRRYRIKRGRVRNVQQVDASGRVLKHFCIHPREEVPDADTMLAQKLLLESMEQEFLRIANHSLGESSQISSVSFEQGST